MKRRAPLVAIFVLALVGCKKEEAPAPPAPTPKTSVSVETMMGQAAPTTAVEGQPKGTAPAKTETMPAENPGEVTPEKIDVNLANLENVVNGYYADTKRKPSSLEQLVAEHYLPRIPQAPAGKRYVLDAASLKVKTVNK